MSGAIGGFGAKLFSKLLSDIIKMPKLKDDSEYEIHIQQYGLDGWYPFPDEFAEIWGNIEGDIKSGTLRRRDKLN